MEYFIELQRRNLVSEIAKKTCDDTNYDFPYIFHSSKIIDHPQKTKHRCLSIRLHDTNSSGDTCELIEVIFDNFGIVRTQAIHSSLPYPQGHTNSQDQRNDHIVIEEVNEHESVSNTNSEFFKKLLENYIEQTALIHGEKYLQESKQYRQENINSLKRYQQITEKQMMIEHDEDYEKIVSTPDEYNYILLKLKNMIDHEKTMIEYLEKIKNQNNEKF